MANLPTTVRIAHPSEPGLTVELPAWLFQRMLKDGYIAFGGDLRSFRITPKGRALLQELRRNKVGLRELAREVARRN